MSTQSKLDEVETIVLSASKEPFKHLSDERKKEIADQLCANLKELLAEFTHDVFIEVKLDG